MTTMRESLAFASYFGSYDWLKTQQVPVLIAGGLAGLLNWTVTYPIDVIKSRQMAQNIGIREAYSQGQLWKGYSVCALRAILVNAAIFYTYETTKRLLDSYEDDDDDSSPPSSKSPPSVSFSPNDYYKHRQQYLERTKNEVDLSWDDYLDDIDDDNYNDSDKLYRYSLEKEYDNFYIHHHYNQ